MTSPIYWGDVDTGKIYYKIIWFLSSFIHILKKCLRFGRGTFSGVTVSKNTVIVINYFLPSLPGCHSDTQIRWQNESIIEGIDDEERHCVLYDETRIKMRRCDHSLDDHFVVCEFTGRQRLFFYLIQFTFQLYFETEKQKIFCQLRGVFNGWVYDFHTKCEGSNPAVMVQSTTCVAKKSRYRRNAITFSVLNGLDLLCAI